MNKWLMRGAAVLLIAGLGTVGAGAAGLGARAGGGQGQSAYAPVCRYVDTDGDGVCDNCAQGSGFVDADGDGVCDNRTGTGGGWRGGRWK